MPNRKVAFALLLLLPRLANASDMAGMFTFYYASFVVVPAFLIHIIATIYFSKKGYFQSKAFTSKYLIVALLIPIIGIALLTFEYLADMSATGIHIGTLVSILFVYGLVSVIFAIPYILHLAMKSK